MFDFDDIPDDVDADEAASAEVADTAGTATVSNGSRVADANFGTSLEIGGVRLAVRGGPLSALVPSVPAPWGAAPSAPSQAELRALRWMMQKVAMRQDMFLLGPPGPRLRHTVLRFCELFHRELEYVSITRDTNEADLKQRREIHGGQVEYVDQPPVRAALCGRVLVLEGIEKAERNVLPLLNNLLENREMALEDGRFLVAPERGMHLDSPSHLLPVHPDFVVVALGLPGRGTPLDPPLRSRFSALVVERAAPSEAVTRLAQVAPRVPENVLDRLVVAGESLCSLAEASGGEWKWLRRLPEGGFQRAARILEAFPGVGIAAVMRRNYPVEALRLTSSQRQAVERILAEADVGREGLAPSRLVSVGRGAERHMAELCFKGESGASCVDLQCQAGRWFATEVDSALGAKESGDATAAAEADELAGIRALPAKGLKAWLSERGVGHADCFEKSDLVERAEEYLRAGRPETSPAPLHGALAEPVAGLRLSASQARMLSACLSDHAVGIDFCLVGEKGAGKSAMVRAFAALLGYHCRTIFCYKDMISRDLLQRRTTDPNGNTRWHDSPLVEAAIRGDLAVLDGAHRLAPGALYSTLGPLLSDRETPLPDGSRLVSPQRWEVLLHRHGGAEALAALGLRQIHAGFRCIACAEPPGSGVGAQHAAWLDDEVTTLFHFHVVEPLPGNEQIALVQRVAGVDSRVTEGLLAYDQDMRKLLAQDPNLEPLKLSIRTLLRIAAHLKSRPGDVQGALGRALLPPLRFMPSASQEAVDRILVGTMRRAGVLIEGFRRQSLTEPSGEETRRRREELMRLESIAINARFGGSAATVDRAREKAEADAITNRRRRLEELRQKAQRAARREGTAEVRVEGGVVTIHDVSHPLRTPARPELVPNVAFVDIPKHVEVLRDMLFDWSLGHHLLLVGNQGVGKNKLADRFLGLLQCEREYVQLHRDTTVQSLTLAPSLEGGVVVWKDSPLVRAAREGRCLVVDEADKAPLEVVCVLKALCEDGELALLDGRTLIRSADPRLAATADAPSASEFLRIADGFRMIVMANRPGFPFMGNDFYRVCGDVFSCHVVDNPDIESEIALLRSVGPDVPEEHVVGLSVLFAELRDLVDAGQLSYPYSTRELVKIVQHLQHFPNDSVEQAAAGVFAFDSVERQRRASLLEVLKRHGLATTEAGEASILGVAHGDMTLRLDEHRDRSLDVTRGDNPDGSNPPPINGGPKHGAWDGGQHIGGNMFAGGSGGTGTAGLGGRWGPYRLDVGQELHMVSEASKEGVDEEVARKAKQMADEAYRKRLDEIHMSPHDAQEYAALRDAVSSQIQEMKVALEGHEAKALERQWLKQQTHGELDDARLIDGITGARTVYMRRGEPSDSFSGNGQSHPKRISFVMDISGSMYTFNRIDRRLRRLMETAIFIFESLDGFEEKYEYRMVGHSGTGPEAERLAEWGKPPRTEKERLEAVKRMEAHAQYCHPGDKTLEGTRMAIADVAGRPADERMVIVVSDADLQRYNIDVREWDRILTSESQVRSYVVMISNNVDEAERIKATMAPGRAHVCTDTSSLAVTFKQIFQDSLLHD